MTDPTTDELLDQLSAINSSIDTFIDNPPPGVFTVGDTSKLSRKLEQLKQATIDELNNQQQRSYTNS